MFDREFFRNGYQFDDDYSGAYEEYDWEHLPSKYSELPYDIWIDGVGCERGENYIPLVRVYLESSKQVIPLSISKSPKILTDTKFEHSEQILQWISDHSDTLLKLWNHDYEEPNGIFPLYDELYTEYGNELYQKNLESMGKACKEEWDDSYGGVEDTFQWLIVPENDTGLPYEIWIDCLGCERGEDNIPEVRVHLKERKLLVPISISESPAIMMDIRFEHSEQIFAWVQVNSELLLRLWKHDFLDEMDEDEAQMSFFRN